MTVSGGRRADWAHDSSGVRNSRAAAADPPVVLPRLGEKFEITGRHAEGAICEVFKAHHVALDIAVAVKVLRHEYADDPRFVERMRIEAQVLSRIKNRHIPQCFDRGFTLDGRPYTVLEFLRGDTLEAALEKVGRLDELTVIEYGSALLEALSVAHDRGVVHRDVTLRNLIVHHTEHEPRTLKLIDFGFAWITPDAPESAPEPAEKPDCDVAVGTPRFTSPEVALGNIDIDGRADLYSTGVVLYTLLAGRDPFAEFETPEAVLEAHAHRPPPPLSHHARTISKPLEHVVMRLLEKDAAHRYPTASEAAQALLKAGDVAGHPSEPPHTVPSSASDRRRVSRSSNARAPLSAPSPHPESPIIRARDTNHCVATWDNVMIQIWHGEVTPNAAADLTEIARALIAEKGATPLGLVFIVEKTSPQPSEQARVLMSAFFRDLSPNYTHRLVVAEGGAFRMALVRSVGLDLSNMASGLLAFTFVSNIQQTATLIAPTLSPASGGAIGFVVALTKLREEASFGETRRATGSF